MSSSSQIHASDFKYWLFKHGHGLLNHSQIRKPRVQMYTWLLLFSAGEKAPGEAPDIAQLDEADVT